MFAVCLQYGCTNRCVFLSGLLSKETGFSQLTDSGFVTSEKSTKSSQAL